MTMEDLLDHQDGPGLLAARAWFDAEIRKAHKRMETCSPEELPRLQGNIELAKRFLRIFQGRSNGD